MRNHEVTNKQLLLNEEGELREPGWSRSMVQQYGRSMVMAPSWRIKEWDYYLVVEIINLCYLSSFRYTGSEAAETIGISEQDFYKKKKYAIIMFALEFEKFKKELSARCNPDVWRGEQMTLADFMN